MMRATRNPSMNVHCTALLRGLRLSCALLLFLCGHSLPARLFEPQVTQAKLEADGETIALYEFHREDFKRQEMPDLLKKQAPGKIEGTWDFVAAE